MAVERYGRFFHDPAAENPDARREVIAKEKVNEQFDAALSGGLFGLVVGGLLGAASGLARRSVGAAVAGLIAAGVLGGLCGAGGGWLDLLGWQELTLRNVERPTAAIAMHAVTFCLAGLGVGLGVGLANGRVLGLALSVAAAGLIGGLLCSPITAFARPMVDADLPIPVDRNAIFIWTLLPAALMGLAAGRALPPTTPRVTSGPA